MRRQLDSDTTDRLLSGTVECDDAPPGFGDVARLLHAAGTLPSEPDARAAEATVAAMVEHIWAAAPLALRRPRRRLVGKVLSAKVAAAVTTLALTTGVAAAASGSLPDSIQDAVAEAASHVGIELPSADNGHAKVGGSGDSHGKAGSRGQPAAHPAEDHGQGQTVSDMVHDEETGDAVGPVVSDWVSDGHSQAGDHGTGEKPAGTEKAPDPSNETVDSPAAGAPQAPAEASPAAEESAAPADSPPASAPVGKKGGTADPHAPGRVDGRLRAAEVSTGFTLAAAGHIPG